MRDYLGLAKKALNAYMERGEKALQYANEEHMELLEAELIKRKAAFHNFRVADQLASDAGYDCAKQPGMEETLTRIDELDQLLEQALQKLLDDVSQKVMKFHHNRKNMGRYHSGAPQKTRIIKSV